MPLLYKRRFQPNLVGVPGSWMHPPLALPVAPCVRRCVSCDSLTVQGSSGDGKRNGQARFIEYHLFITGYSGLALIARHDGS